MPSRAAPSRTRESRITSEHVLRLEERARRARPLSGRSLDRIGLEQMVSSTNAGDRLTAPDGPYTSAPSKRYISNDKIGPDEHGRTCRIVAEVEGTLPDMILQERDDGDRHEAAVDAAELRRGRCRGDRHARRQGGAGAGVDEVVHATTVATDAVLERRGSRTALVTNGGFLDVLELAGLRTPQMNDLF